MKKSAGFTLLEILLVVVLMATTAMLVVQTLPTNQHDEIEQEATRLYHKLQLLSDDAMLNGQDYGLHLDDIESGKTLTFMSLGDEGWQPIQDSKFYQPIELDGDLSFFYQLGGSAWQDDDRLFNPGDLFEEDKFADLEEDKKPEPPQIYVLSSGEMTPVSIYFSKNGSKDKQTWRVLITESGVIYLLSPQDEDPELESDN